MRRLRRSQEGQALVEFALVLPVLLLLILGIIQFGSTFHDYITVTDAVRAGARQAAVSRSVADPVGATVTRVKESAAGLDPNNLAITVDPKDPSDGSAKWVQGGDVTVTAQYPFSINLLGLVVFSGHIKSRTTERVE